MIQFDWYRFHELTPEQVYAVLVLRANVFIVEQGIHCADPDGKDLFARHLLGTEDGVLVAYLRLFPPVAPDNRILFGRVLTDPAVRAKGYGKKLIQALLDFCHAHFPDATIACSSQYHVRGFYEQFGFVAQGEAYEEEQVLHIVMEK